jgi:NADPH:quinone reductase-like Zn-dependent oxidoreductase
MTPENATASTTPTTMAAVVGRRYGSPDVLAIERVPTPAPRQREVLVQVAAASLNALDWHYLTGTPYFLRVTAGFRRPKRTIPGADVAGTVVATGPGVTDISIGDAVFGECGGGGCATYASVPADRLVLKPAAVSFEAAAATPVAGVTALEGLRTHAALRPGERALINGAAGGVGTFAVQIAKALGADVTAVCSTRNVDMIRALGADEVIDYTNDDVVRGGARFDVMFDNVGDRSPDELMRLLRPGARYVVVTGPKTNRWLGPVPHLIRARWAFRRGDASFHQFIASMDHDDLTYLSELLATRRVTPAIDRVIRLDGVAAGLAEIGTGHTRAKIVVVPT